jgi:hypothetical protein
MEEQMRKALFIILTTVMASPAAAQDYRSPVTLTAPQGQTLTQRITNWGEQYVPKNADVQNGYVGYKPEGSHTVWGVKQGHKGFMAGFSVKF